MSWPAPGDAGPYNPRCYQMPGDVFIPMEGTMNNESKGYDRPDRDSTTPQANFVCVVQLALANLRAAIECNDRDYQSLKESYNRQAEEIYSLQAAAAHRALVMDGLRDELRQARQQIEYLQAMNRGGPPYVSPGLTD